MIIRIFDLDKMCYRKFQFDFEGIPFFNFSKESNIRDACVVRVPSKGGGNLWVSLEERGR